MGRRALIVGALAVLVAVVLVLLREDERGQRVTRDGVNRRAPATGSKHGKGVSARPTSVAADRLSGWVVDADGAPVEEGALVFTCAATGRPIRGSTVVLDLGGGFESLGCGGPVCAQLQHPTLIQSGPWVLQPGAEAELHARPLGRLAGVLRDEDGLPVAGAVLVAAPSEEDPTALPPFISSSTTSDGEGRFAFARVEMPPCDPCGETRGRCADEAAADRIYRGPVVVVARASGFRNAAITVDSAADHVDVVLELPGVVTAGSLVGSDGAGFARAHVIARSETRPHDSHSAELHAGRFELPSLGEGPHQLRFIQDGVELARVDGVVAGAKLELETTGPASGVRVEIAVQTADGMPVAGARVDGGPFRGAITGETGRVSADAVIPGRYSIRARATHGTRVQSDLVVGARAVQLALMLPEPV